MKIKDYYNNKKFRRATLILIMSAIVFTLVNVLFSGFWLIYIIMDKIPFIDNRNLPAHTNLYIFLGLSLITGIVLSIIFRKYVLIPLHEAYLALGTLSDGIFDISVDEKGIRAVRTVAKSINITARELGALENMRNDFINNFSHEFKTPIVSISGFAKKLKDPSVTQERKDEYIDIIISESDRLSQLSANVLSLTRLSNQSLITNLSSYNVTEQIRRAIISLEQKWSDKSIIMSFDSEEFYITANEELLSQLWINLLDNAIKFSPTGAEIRTAITKNGNNLHFTFEDQGKGMDEETAKHAFDKFYQGDSSHHGAGTGIGLAIAKRICELHSGDIKIKSTSEKGTVFEVILPTERN